MKAASLSYGGAAFVWIPWRQPPQRNKQGNDEWDRNNQRDRTPTGEPAGLSRRNKSGGSQELVCDGRSSRGARFRVFERKQLLSVDRHITRRLNAESYFAPV